MAGRGSAELAGLLSQLKAHSRGRTASPPTPSEAMAMYFVAARLVELQMQLVDRGECDDQEIAVTREVLIGTHRMLNAALDGAEPVGGYRPKLERAARRRPRGRTPRT